MFADFKNGLSKTRQKLGEKLGYLFRSRGDEGAFFEELEDILISSDAGMDATKKIAEDFKRICAEENIFGSEKMLEVFITYLASILPRKTLEFSEKGLTVLMLYGVNGTGKTTTSGKLGAKFLGQKKSVMFAAADTFRAAAIEQLCVWGDRLGVTVIKQKTGADPGAVVFDAITSAKAKNIDVLIVDTAGRFHNKQNLVKELEKVDRIAAKKLEPDDTLLNIIVLDATAGGNAYTQAMSFAEHLETAGCIVTKMDSSARGGVVLALAEKLPVFFLGFGEKIEDLVEFDADSFARALVE